MKIWEQITPETWCQGVFSMDQDGASVLIDSPLAIKWCLMGWIDKVYRETQGTAYLKLMECGIRWPATFNDTHLFNEILEVLKKADV